ncbi:hypothetical protein N7493_005005 [Penicillium malachiteum]|uniref:Uncharacterized protein n=1 Tax=Penicillium malachiteum TaxID=1324776 RepID=A0AAD6MW55_9EURO|nr:hypothetical protein N7493_005005 [Penicillium malachiteum]
MYRPNQSDTPQQPEWQLPARRPERAQPPPPRRPPTATYTPATYGPISPASPIPHPDTRTWGVQYNKHEVHAPPPLPPRPSSTNEQPYAYAQAPSLNTNVPPSSGQNHEAFADAQPGSATSIPPPYNFPPPQNQTQHQQYQNTPNVPAPPPKIPQNQDVPAQQSITAAQPPLLAHGISPAASQGSYGVPPNPSFESNSAAAFSSALGPGPPSGWEHFGSTEADFDDSPWFPPRETAQPSTASVQTPPVVFPTAAAAPMTSTAMSAAPPQPQSNINSRNDTPVSMYPTSVPQRTDSISPISPSAGYGGHTPPPPARVDTADSIGSWSQRADSIDNVIDAWVKPLEPSPRPAQLSPADLAPRPDISSPKSPVEAPRPVQSSPHDLVVKSSTSTPIEAPPSVAAPQNVDPYEDLDPWFKSSLTRYISMLRKEAVADSDDERYKIFTAFMAKEAKLREILYNIEHEPAVTEQKPQSSSRAPDPSPPRAQEPQVPIESGLIPVETEEENPMTNENVKPQVDDGVSDGSDANYDTGSDSEYSAGGRPVLRKQTRRGSVQWQPNLSLLSSEEAPKGHSAQVSSVPDLEEKQPLDPLTTNPPMPIYTPFQYTEGPQRGSDNLTFDRPAYQAYSDLRQASANGRVMSNVPPGSSNVPTLTLSTAAQSEHDETFLGIIRHKSNAYKASGRRSTTPLTSLPESLRQGPHVLIEDLRAMVWKPLDKQSESPWHITTRKELEKFSDLSYVQQAIDEWERPAAARRQRIDQDRTARQEDSESQVDALFNRKEIGYADINILEEDFRQTEARTQLDEEREEVEKFITEVLNTLDERLKNEISALRKSYDSALGHLEREQQDKNNASDRRSPSMTMKIVNEIHGKLEDRFQKRLELALDSERRRKRAERRPLVFMGDKTSLQKLDGDFDRMEKRNILEAAKDRDGRANRLMDSFDDAILHGLGMNQSLLDELASKAARLDSKALRNSGLPDSEIQQILKSTSTFTASLRADSESILRCSGVAEMELNDADYAVSVAEAQYANSEPDIFERLEAEKTKEDSSLQGDLESKLQSIQKGPQDLDSTIERVIRDLARSPKFPSPMSSDAENDGPMSQPAVLQSLAPLPLGLRPASVAPSPTPAPASQSPDLKTEHQDRLRKALEDAKKRNAARANQ